MDNLTAMSTKAINPSRGECVGLTGSLESAWQHCFPNGLPWLTIIWHEGWLYRSDKTNYWRELREKLSACKDGTQLLVVIFDETPARPRGKRGGNPIEVLLRVIAEGAVLESGSPKRCPGWASVSEINQFASRVVTWKPSTDGQESSLLRLCAVCEALLETNGGDVTGENPKSERRPVPGVEEFFEFLDDPKVYRARKLHAAGDKANDAKLSLRILKWLEAFVFVPSTLPLNVLVVENNPDELCKAMADLKDRLGQFAIGGCGPAGFFSKANVYLLRNGSDFDKLGRQAGTTDFEAEIWNPSEAIGNKTLPKATIPWKDLDLVLQDIVLDKEGTKLHGLDLVSHYFEACPQALVIVMTSLDVESLVGSGDVNWRYVDCIISKDATEILPYEYRRCFHERFGRMFWLDWRGVFKMDESERAMLRGLFASLRKWQIEPDILWHGQTLPEMIDHANRHITALWRLTNDFVGTLLDNGGANRDVLSLRHRVGLAIAVWMHDVGHRGDEFTAGSMDIRASHAGISERLLLRNPDAYGLKWLLELGPSFIPHGTCRSHDGVGRETRLQCRNQTTCLEAGKPICLLREIGLLCRHHQSNAPLGKDSLSHMAGRGKAPSVYSLASCPEANPVPSEVFLLKMTNDSLPMPSPLGTVVLTLEEFFTHSPQNFRSLAGLLRMLDALQLHRARVGTGAFLASFEEFLETRFKWCGSERSRLEKALRAATPGTLAAQRAMGDLDVLDEYELLLTTQKIHFWRQAAAHDVLVRWGWKASGVAAIEIRFILNERALSDLKLLKVTTFKDGKSLEPIPLYEKLERINRPLQTDMEAHEHNAAIKGWLHNLENEVVGEEHESQYPPSGSTSKARGYLGTLAGNVEFRVGVIGTDRMEFGEPFFISTPPLK